MPKRIYRSENKIIGGVCGGLGEYLDIDPVIIRLIWAVAVFASMGVALLIYLVSWLIIPMRHSRQKR